MKERALGLSIPMSRHPSTARLSSTASPSIGSQELCLGDVTTALDPRQLDAAEATLAIKPL